MISWDYTTTHAPDETTQNTERGEDIQQEDIQQEETQQEETQQEDIQQEEESSPTFPNDATLLYSLCNDLKVIPFRAQGMGGHFVRFPVGAHYEIDMLGSQRFESWLTGKFFTAREIDPKKAGLEGALRLLRADADYERSPQRRIFTRIGRDESGEKFYLDLCNSDHQVVEISAEGWRVLDDPPVWFWRTSSMQELPIPERDGTLDLLREFVNTGEDDFILIVGWLIAALHPDIKYPILSISAEHGSGKSTLTGFLKDLIDPDSAGAVAPFKDIDALCAVASSRHIVGLDNLSRISAEDSDNLCRLSTGGGFAKRRLYTDNDVVDIYLRKPIILNGIDFAPDRADLLDRCYPVSLLPLTAKRKLDSELKQSFQSMRPQILGALLSAVSAAMRTQAGACPLDIRMADVAEFVMRAEKAGGLPWSVGTFERVLRAKSKEKIRANVLDNIVGREIYKLSEQGYWHRPISELFNHIKNKAESEGDMSAPKSTATLGRAISRLKPSLRSMGVTVETGHGREGNWVRIKREIEGDYVSFTQKSA